MPHPPLVVVVPYHNEERYLPTLITSLRAQRGTASIPIVFVDNGSTDRSAAIIQGCDETRSGQWISIEERHVGKFFAMQTATAFAVERFGATHIAFIDADSYCGDDQWLAHCRRLAADAGCGYTYSSFQYVGIDHLPTFARVCQAQETVLSSLMQRIGWLAVGMGFLCTTDVLRGYFEVARATTEIDLRLSLLALCEGTAGHLNPAVIMTSGRRIVVNRRNFEAWCFYDRAYYVEKDINAVVKLDLNAPAAVDDLRPDMIERFFERRALKSTCRHLIPFVIFDSSDAGLGQVAEVLGTDVSAGLRRGLGHFRGQQQFIVGDQFEAMVGVIERDPAAIEVARRIEHLMHQAYANIRSP
jgi:glycosyltransferase involved in cell wall biosynthesis